MEFITVRELRNQSAEVWQRLKKEKELVITSNGKPIAVISPILGGSLEESLKLIRRVRALHAVEKIQEKSAKSGLDQLTDPEIAAEIKSARKRQRL